MDDQKKKLENDVQGGYAVPNVAQNAAVGSENAPQGPSVSVSGNDGGLNEKSHQQPLNSLTAQNAKPKTAKKWLIWVALGAALLAVGGIVTWVVIASQKPEEHNPSDNPSVSENEPETPGKLEDGAVSIDVNDELVQRLYKDFDRVIEASRPALLDVYDEGKLNNLQKYMVALNNLSLQMTPCKNEHRLFTYTDENGVDQYNVYEAGFAGCISGDLIREEMTKVFGGEYDLADFAGEDVIVDGDGFVYYKDGDEAVNVASGATIDSGFVRELYEAQRDSDHVYLYEALYRPCIAMSGDEECFLSGGISSDGNYGDFTYEQRYYKKNGELIEELTNAMLEGFNVKDNLGLLDKYKWTFKKNTEGNYIFEKMEKLN